MSTDILSRIVTRKQEEVAEARKRVPESEMRSRAEQKPRDPRGFLKRLSRPGVNIIAEIKRASPSKGSICPDLDPAAYARQYEAGGAACLSVLTDRDFFQGSFEDLQAARNAVSLPVIRKDFMISPYQFYEAAVQGADAVLLIVRILEPEQLRDYLQLAGALGMDALTEVHSEEELETATKAGAKLVGVNNRNLRSFETNVSHSANMASRFAPDQVAVAESGIKTREDVENLLNAGIHNFLIGESIVRAPDPAGFIRSLMGE
ncbi:indole-3-glycerol phosphate synthase [Desulfonema ishimotonii]|uniref:Indole-3-glycerol phosphate synthase n=1 Tax=Desulfonema ishimotonii TaxID=45657 RepID=A0A401FU83_9BACT|nr:indole-3-glycerol phosphate synthase TrpC [Desulfonema ishimotonii]GBC60529.1 indole-3-glycerol phosphate synthase [Desulfonema ishimotonii]